MSDSQRRKVPEEVKVGIELESTKVQRTVTPTEPSRCLFVEPPLVSVHEGFSPVWPCLPVLSVCAVGVIFATLRRRRAFGLLSPHHGPGKVLVAGEADFVEGVGL